ncbi:hypothetical protein VNO80_25922 [Phaseolus coccineus]|uniref:Uncharacterized protein n=1 Tax=Phaseolus coccineus TaxID=3886 RepID=A0AAN9QTU1_PHACN
MMIRKPKSMCYLDEVAPFVLKSHHQRRSNSVKLETIVEDERQEFNSLSKSVFVSFPLVLSGLLYILLCRGVMMRKTKSIHYLGEVAPNILKSHYKRRPNFVKLETIVEEERQGYSSMYKNVLISFPLLLSGFLYIFVCREMV